MLIGIRRGFGGGADIYVVVWGWRRYLRRGFGGGADIYVVGCYFFVGGSRACLVKPFRGSPTSPTSV